MNRSNYTMIIVMGDFNAHYSVDTHSSTAVGSVFAYFLRGNNFTQLIKELTRITATSQTILDFVITDSPGYCTSHFTLSPAANCDHNVVAAKFNLSVPRPKAYKRSVWNFNSVDDSMLNNSLYTENWSDLFNNFIDINSLYYEWFTKFTSIVKEYIPFWEVIIRPRDKTWMTSTIRSAMRKRDRFLRKFQLTKSLTDWNKYKSQRNLNVGIVRKRSFCILTN